MEWQEERNAFTLLPRTKVNLLYSFQPSTLKLIFNHFCGKFSASLRELKILMAFTIEKSVPHFTMSHTPSLQLYLCRKRLLVLKWLNKKVLWDTFASYKSLLYSLCAQQLFSMPFLYSLRYNISLHNFPPFRCRWWNLHIFAHNNSHIAASKKKISFL